MNQPIVTHTYTRHPAVWVGDDVDLTTRADRGDTGYPADIFIRDVAGETVDTLHLSPTAARKLRDSLTLVLVEIEVATIEAAGLETETTSYPEALAIVHSVNETGRVSA